MNTRLLFLHAFSPLHPGSGQSVGAIDLAIAREKSTNIPYLPGSSIKGVLRDRFSSRDEKLTEKLFGPPTENASDYAGSLQFGDGRLVFLPVRSLAGTFAFVTSPYLLDRLAVDLEESATALSFPKDEFLGRNMANVATASALLQELGGKEKVVLEDLDLDGRGFDSLATFGKDLGQAVGGERLAKSMQSRICVVHDDVMSFLLEKATDVAARIRLKDETKTVAKGALWYEESLPAESILAALVVAAPPKKANLDAAKALEHLDAGLEGMTQFGGKATVGKGFCRLKLTGGEA